MSVSLLGWGSDKVGSKKKVLTEAQYSWDHKKYPVSLFGLSVACNSVLSVYWVSLFQSALLVLPQTAVKALLETYYNQYIHKQQDVKEEVWDTMLYTTCTCTHDYGDIMLCVAYIIDWYLVLIVPYDAMSNCHIWCISCSTFGREKWNYSIFRCEPYNFTKFLSLEKFPLYSTYM